ncbi:MAG: GDP-mannose 4,6-dehydratase [Bacteroidales bacterium]|nr:GDP-mannose 4,6-dehydratase [Bacteroidales bacterium]
MNTILVTGSSGFIGRKLTEKLRVNGFKVIEFDLPDGDVTKEGILNSMEKIDHVFHLAGKTFVPESWKNPFGFYRVNFLGTVNVLEYCRKSGASLTYVASYLYGEPDYLPVDEKHPVKSYNPYSHGKVMADNTCQFYASQFGVNITIFRPFNAYGPGQSPVFLIPEIIAKVLSPSEPVVKVMDLRPRRDYLYIDDLVDALLCSLGHIGGIYNLGSGYSVGVEEIIKMVMDFTGIRKPMEAKGTVRPNEIFDLYADISKAETELGWKPKISFSQGLQQCIDALKS